MGFPVSHRGDSGLLIENKFEFVVTGGLWKTLEVGIQAEMEG
jgi:hypothetical protein